MQYGRLICFRWAAHLTLPMWVIKIRGPEAYVLVFSRLRHDQGSDLRVFLVTSISLSAY